MMKFRLENDSEPVISTSKRKKIVSGVILCVLLIGVFAADDWHQKRFATLRHGYFTMEQHQYEEATEDFEEYLDVDSKLYWYLLEHINNDESYSREKVRDCLEQCTALQAKIYQAGM